MYVPLHANAAFSQRLRQASNAYNGLADVDLRAVLRPYWVRAMHDMMSGNDSCPCRLSPDGVCMLEDHIDELEAIFQGSDVSFERFREVYETSQQLLVLTIQ